MANVNKTRKPIMGGNATTISGLLAGTVSACVISTAAGASAAGSAAITGVKQGDVIFLTTACTNASCIVTSASVVTDNSVNFKTYNSGAGTAAASTITLQYFVVQTVS